MLSAAWHVCRDAAPDEVRAGSRRVNSYEFFNELLDDPLYEGSRVTLRETVYAYLKEKQDGRATDNYVDRTTRFLSKIVLPEENNMLNMPQSLYLLKRLMRVKHAEVYEKHLCHNDCMKFPDLEPATWVQHAVDVCDTCGERRFVIRRGRLEPAKRFWDFGIAAVLRKLWSNGAWKAALQLPRDLHRSSVENGRSDYWNSREWDRVREAVGKGPLVLCRKLHAYAAGLLGRISPIRWTPVVLPAGSEKADTALCLEMGFDFGQMFTFKNHSSGILVVRLVNKTCIYLCRCRMLLVPTCVQALLTCAGPQTFPTSIKVKGKCPKFWQ